MLGMWTAGVYGSAPKKGERGVDVCYALVPFFRGISYPIPRPHRLWVESLGYLLVTGPQAARFCRRASRVGGGRGLLCVVCESRFPEYMQGRGRWERRVPVL